MVSSAPSRQRTFTSGLGLVFLCVYLIACSTIRVTRPTVKIGLAGPFEGQYRYVGYDAIYAARLALQEANAAGGVGGFMVQLVAFDDRGTVAGARNAARNLALDSQLVAVIGHFRTDTTKAARALYDQAGVPLLVAGTVEGDPSSERELLCLLLGYLENAMHADAEDPARAWKTLRVLWIAPDQGVILRCGEKLAATSVTRLPPALDADMVLLTLDPVAAGETLLTLREKGWDGVIAGGPTLSSPLFAQIADPTEVIFISPYRMPDLAGQDADFAVDYRSLGLHAPSPGPFALTTYEAAQVLLKAIEAAAQRGENVTRQNLAPQLTQTPITMGYIYRWSRSGMPELLGTVPPMNRD